MPLVKYEVRCEHSLANPELYRSAAPDDVEGLLEGVAMAGLVGIVRQLGDLAEFAAEIFRDLHDELMAIGGRDRDLMARLQQLETELPVVEKALLSEPNQLRFAVSPGLDWHANNRNEQNHCTQGDLPRFIRNFYEDCRGPPRLFLLDKFDVAGASGAAGACLKRYTDPSFFKLEWASSELMKAQRAQREKKPHRDKKKGRRRMSGQPKMTQIPSRVHYGSVGVEDVDGLPHHHLASLNLEKPDMDYLPASHGAGIQKWRSSAVPTAVHVAEESLVCLSRRNSGTASKLEIAGSEPLPNEPFKRIARDKEAAAAISDNATEIMREDMNSSGNPSGLNETKNGYDGLSVANASVLVGMEDYEATNMLVQDLRCMSGEGTEATASADQTSTGNLREDIEAAGMGGMPSRCASKQEIVATGVADKTLSKSSMNEESEALQMIRKLSSHSLKDVGEPAETSSEALIHASVAINDGAPGKILRQRSLETSEVSNRGGSCSQRSSNEDGDDVVPALNTMGSDDESDFEARAQGLSVVSEIYEAANSTPHDSLKLSHLQMGVAEKPLHETRIDPSLHQTSPVSGTLSGGPSSSSISSNESEGPMVKLEKSLHSRQQGITNVTRTLERETFKLTPSRDGLTHDTSHGLDVRKVHDLHIEEIASATPDQVHKESGIGHDQLPPSTTMPSMWMPGKPILEPNVSDLSRFSYSSSCSLMSVSSYSAPSTPSTPKSPLLNVTSSPSSRLPLCTPQETLDFPWGFLNSLSFKGSSSSQSDPGSPSSPIKSPILLSLPLTSSSPYPSLVPPLEQEDNPSLNDSVPSNLATPSQITPVSVLANPTHLCSSLLPKPLYPLHSPQFLEPDLQQSQVNSPPDKELSPSSVSIASLEPMHQHPPDAGIELQPSPSSMLQTNPASSLLQNALPKPTVSEPGRSTAILPVCTSDSPKSSAPLNPVMSPQCSSPQPSSPRCELTAALPTPASPGLSSQSSRPGSYRWNAPQSSNPPSPTGSVIIKDSPSPSVSPISNDSHSPRSGPCPDVPVRSRTGFPLSPSAQLDLVIGTNPAQNLDHEDRNCAEGSALLLETQGPRLSRSLDFNSHKQPAAIDPDFSEGWNQSGFDMRTGEIPHRKSHSNSPPQSIWLDSSSSQLRWQSRSELVSLPPKLVIPDFFLPPNLARSPDSRSPSCSPCPSETHSHRVHQESPSPSETPSSSIVVPNLASKSAVSHCDPAERSGSEHDTEFLSQIPAIPELNTSADSHALLEQTHTLQASDSIEPATTMTPLQLIHPQAPSSAGEFALRKTADEELKDPLAAVTAIAADNRNMVPFQELGRSLVPPPTDERQIILEQIRTKSFNLRHTEKEKKEPVVQPLKNINVAVILEKANAIRQAFVGSDEEDEWSDT